jgi:NDP-sugar pyrophosphorylase family protein
MKSPAWRDEKLNILIPMAGAGSRFEQAGYTFPKPLIDVKGKPMIQVVVENLNIKANYIYIVQKSHREKYNLDTLLNLITPGCKIVE